MTPEILLNQHQRYKEMTRLEKARGLRRLLAGGMATMTGRRVLRLYRNRRPALPEPLPADGAYVISLTSFPPRMENLWIVVDLLMRQTVRPAAVYLCLYEGDFPGKKLPSSLDPYLERGLQVLWAEEDMKPHLKYFYAFRKEAEGLVRPVMTADDDLFYAPDTASRLLRLHAAYPEAVCANIVRRIEGEHYAGWPLLTEAAGPSEDLLALGFGGVLYPPAFFRFGPLYDREKILRTSLKADDLWLKHIERKAGIPVVSGDYFAHPAEVPSSQLISLSSQNVAGAGNDRVWEALQGEK